MDTYADLLGNAGLARYRDLAEAAWAKLPAPDPDRRAGYDPQRRHLSRILELLAQQTGDLDAIVAVKRRDLSNAYTYWDIAQLYQEAGKPDQALQWAEAGLQAFPERTDRRLRDFAIQAYLNCGRLEDAAAIAWTRFTEFPSLEQYQCLKTVTYQGKRPAQNWSRWRQQALDYIRQQIKLAKQQRYSPQSYHYHDHSLLVEILLWEGETELAWQEAKAGQCSESLWLQLAERLQPKHPDESLRLYQEAIEPLIQQTNNDAYAQAVDLIKQVKALMLRLNQQAQYQDYVNDLRLTYKNKRNFIKLLNAEAL